MRGLLRGRQAAPIVTAPTSSELLVAGLKAAAGAAALQADREPPELNPTGLASRPIRFDEVTQGWFGYWAAALNSAPRPHRKLWEFAAVLQAMFDRGLLVRNARALGVGVGDEPVASWLATLGLAVTATDLPQALDRGRVWRSSMLPQADFDSRTTLAAWDVTAGPGPETNGFDMAWSCGLLNLLGGVEPAMTAVKAVQAQLRPGGWAFHTFDLAIDGLESGGGGAFTPEEASRLAGGELEPGSFDLGDHPLDGYVDPPPFEPEGLAMPALFADRGGAPHLKVLIDGRAVTSYLLILSA